MISLLHLNKLTFFVIFFTAIIFNSAFGENEAVDIWKKTENSNETSNQIDVEVKIENQTLSEDISKIKIKINENQISEFEDSIIGIFDPDENNFSMDMWSQSNGEDIKKILKRIDKLKLSALSEDLLFKVLFTNSYSPKKNLNSEEFLNLKVNWLIKKKRVKDLETLLKNNPEVGKNSKAIKFLINEYISSADIKSACKNVNFIDKKVENNYLEKFLIYCLINNDRKNEAQLVFDLLKERGFQDNFFEDKTNFLLGVTDTTTQKILDDNLLNFYFSHVTNKNFQYTPTNKTDKYIWRYLSSANLIEIEDLEDEETITTYEEAAAQNSFDKDEIFKIYLKMDFNFNQLLNAQEFYKNIANYKARALIYQSILLADDVEKKIKLAFLLKDLFSKDKLQEIYNEEFVRILKSIDPDKIPPSYSDSVNRIFTKNLDKNIKFDNSILHRSKVIKHFLENNEKLSKTEKDFKSVYKKIKKNKKYFVSIKDIVVLESLQADGISIPKDLDYKTLSSQLTVPKSLQELAEQNQTGLVMLKIIEIIGEDKVSNLDSETIYFLNRILNELNLKKIRNNILSEALPVKV